MNNRARMFVLAIIVVAVVYIAANFYNDHRQRQREPDPVKRQIINIERRTEENANRLMEQVDDVLEKSREARER